MNNIYVRVKTFLHVHHQSIDSTKNYEKWMLKLCYTLCNTQSVYNATLKTETTSFKLVFKVDC